MQVQTPDLSIFSARADRSRPGRASSDVSAPRDGLAATSIGPPRRRWTTRILVPGLILGGAIGVLAYAARDALAPRVPVQVVPVMVRSGVAAAAGSTTVQAPGWVEAAPFAHSASALISGIVAEVLVLEGQPVEAGQVVARLVDADARLALRAAEAELAERRSALIAAEAQADAAQRTWDNPVDLTRAVAAAQAMLAERRAELTRWPAELAAEEALAAELEAELRRIEPLQATGEASAIELIRAQKRFDAQQAKVQATRAREAILTAQIAAAQADHVAAAENLRLRIGETQALAQSQAQREAARAAILRAEASVDQARLTLERTEVRAPVAGVVAARLVAPGSKLMLDSDMAQSAQVVRIYDPRQLQVRADVPLGEVAAVGVGQRAEIVVNVLPDRVFSGVVTRVVHEADIQKNTLQIKVQIDDPTPEVKPEMLARVRFLAEAKESGGAPSPRIFVPESLVERRGSGDAFVWLADRVREAAVHQPVTLGAARLEGWIEIASGLSPGDRLIADAPPGLSNGRSVRIVGETEAVAGHHEGGPQ